MLDTLQPAEGATKKRMRVGRGIGSGKGKTCGRGVKGQKSRSGHKVNGFEGGQMPIYKRLPKRGFHNHNRREYTEVTLDRLQAAIDSGKLSATGSITEATLQDAGVVKGVRDGVRLIGTGELTTKVDLEISGASKPAVAAVEKAGGKVKLTVAPKASSEDKGKKAKAAAKDSDASKKTKTDQETPDQDTA